VAVVLMAVSLLVVGVQDLLGAVAEERVPQAVDLAELVGGHEPSEEEADPAERATRRGALQPRRRLVRPARLDAPAGFMMAIMLAISGMRMVRAMTSAPTRRR